MVKKEGGSGSFYRLSKTKVKWEVIKMKLTVHIILFNKGDLANRENVFVVMEGVSHIKHFRSMLSCGTHEKAMMFALSSGTVIDPRKINGSNHVILTKEGVYWDMMG